MSKVHTDCYTNLTDESGNGQDKLLTKQQTPFAESKEVQLSSYSDIGELNSEFIGITLLTKFRQFAIAS